MRPEITAGRFFFGGITREKPQESGKPITQGKRKRRRIAKLNAETRLGFELLVAAQTGRHEKLKTLLDQGAPANFIDPATGATALHYIAAYAARPAFRVLLRNGQCDFLIRDTNGRLASELAGVYGRDLVMERLLHKKEIKQAKAAGIDPKSLYKRTARSPGDRAVPPAN